MLGKGQAIPVWIPCRLIVWPFLSVLRGLPGACLCPCRLVRLLYRSHRAILEGRVVVFCWVVTVSGGWDPAVDPVLCSPYEEPDRFWSLDESGRVRAGVPWLESRRDPVVVGTAPADQKLGVQQAVLELGVRRRNELVGDIREAVSEWRAGGYGGVTATTRVLLHHWADAEGPLLRLFYAQREAIETIIWLREVSEPSDAGPSKVGGGQS